MSIMRNAVVRMVRRWQVYECPDHGLLDGCHALGDLQCPVFVKGTQCEHNLAGPVVVEEVLQPEESLEERGESRIP